MEPEDIDKLFKDRLANLPATPASDAWARLQQKMEPPKKARSMWIYYAAASITLLIIAGLWFYNNQYSPESETLATVNKPKASAVSPLKTATPVTIIPEKINTAETQIAQAENVPSEIKQKLKTQLPVVKGYEKAEAPVIAKVKKPMKAEKNLAKEKNYEPTHSPALVASAPEEKATLDGPDKPGTAAVLTASIIEVKIKRDSPEEEERSDLRENLARKTNLLKNIYKQARNLKNGEQVELTSLGIDTDKINAEKKEIKEKLNKVISL